MKPVGVGIEDGLPVVILQGEDENEMVVERCVGIHKNEPVLVREYRRVFYAQGKPFMAFEASLN